MSSDTIENEIDSLADTLTEAIKGKAAAGVPHIVIEDRQFRTFKNSIDFAVSPEGLGLVNLWEYNRQYQYLRDFYSLICVNCNPTGGNPEMPYDAWGKTPSELQSEILFEFNDTGIMQCPQCGLLQSDSPNFKDYRNLIGDVGMRSGKTILAAIICLYELHLALLLACPQKYWGLVPGQEVYWTLATTKSEQAKDTIFAAVDGIWSASPWFGKYDQALRRLAQEQDIPFEKVFIKNLSEIRYLHKQLFVDVTGANSASIAGKTRMCVVIDEVSRFTDTESRLGVDAVYDTLKASLLTLSEFGSKMICISSPIYDGDKISQLYAEALEKKLPRTLAFHHATWNFNPKLPRNHPFIVEQFEKDPVVAERDFGANPPGALNPAIPSEWIDWCVDPEIIKLVHTEDYVTSLIVKGVRTDMISKRILMKDITTTKNIVIACDPGHRLDSFGMILAYTKAIRTVHGIEEHLFIGSALAWNPTQKPKREVDHINTIRCIMEFAKHWNVQKVVYDQWNSIIAIQDLQGKGIDAEKIPLVENDWNVLRVLFHSKQIHLLTEETGGADAKKLIVELKHLGLNDRGRVDHPPGGSSDLAVCLCRAAKVLLGPDVGKVRAWETRARYLGRTISFRR